MTNVFRVILETKIENERTYEVAIVVGDEGAHHFEVVISGEGMEGNGTFYKATMRDALDYVEGCIVQDVKDCGMDEAPRTREMY